MNAEEYLQLLKDRYSVRKFSDQPVTQEELDVLLAAAQLSPTVARA